MKTKLLITALLIVLIAETAFLVLQKRQDEQRIQVLNSTNAKLQTSISTLQENLDDAKTQINIMHQTIEQQTATIEELNVTVTNLNADNTALQSKLNIATSRLQSALNEKASLSDDLTKAKSELQTYKSVAMCSGRSPSINYTSNSTVSTSLKAWLEDRKGSIDNAEWDVIWNNARPSYHKLSGEFLWPYIVYFDEEDFGYIAGVFDVSRQCWLDLAIEK